MCIKECGYNCHEQCSKMVVQCRPPRRVSPDALSVTDSEAESVSKYTSPRSSFDTRHLPLTDDHAKQTSLEDKGLRSPTVKAYRKSLKHHVQNTIVAAGQQPLNLKTQDTLASPLSPHITAKAFTRVVARSRFFFNLSQRIYDVYSWQYPPVSAAWVILWVLSCKQELTPTPRIACVRVSHPLPFFLFFLYIIMGARYIPCFISADPLCLGALALCARRCAPAFDGPGPDAALRRVVARILHQPRARAAMHALHDPHL